MREFWMGMPCKANKNDGDSMLWAGLLHAANAGDYSEAISLCQSGDGRLWRAPSRVAKQTENSFSRDMAVGFLLAWARARYYGSIVEGKSLSFVGRKWANYLQKTNKLCPDSTDSRHIITPAIWWMIAFLAPDKVPFFYRHTKFLLPIVAAIESYFAPAGYPSHLKACIGFFMFLVTNKKPSLIGWILFKKDSKNPFFQWLANKPVIVPRGEPGRGHQWAWERDSAEQAWLDSCGHDYIFINRLKEIR
jgi:hypothetical protein